MIVSASQTPSRSFQDTGVQCELLRPESTGYEVSPSPPPISKNITFEAIATFLPRRLQITTLHPSMKVTAILFQDEEMKHLDCQSISTVCHATFFLLPLIVFNFRSASDSEPTEGKHPNMFYLVTETALLSLFVAFIFCGKKTAVTKTVCGTFLKIIQNCCSCLKTRI